MSSFSVPAKFTTAEESMAWFATNCDSLKSMEETDFIQAIHDLKSALPKVSKKTPVEDRKDAPYNAERCDARVWLKPGDFAGQCNCKKVDGQDLCNRHQKESNDNGDMVRNGFYNQERPTHAYGNTEDKLLTWHDVVVEKSTKAKKKSGTSKPRCCGNCGEPGHTKRNCPNATAEVKPKSKGFSEEELLKMLEVAQAAKAAEAEVEAEKAAEVEQNSVELQEDILSPASQSAAGTGIAAQESQEGSEDEEQEEEEQVKAVSSIDCTFEEIPYTRDQDNVVYDDEFDEVGTWEEGMIVFTNLGKKTHRSLVAALCNDS
jgi:hypothetical protein